MECKKPDAILRALTAAGYSSYYVGGCVRDALLLRPAHDWDIATAALPAQVQALFAKTVPTGLRHGTVTVLLGEERAEVTTFRRDGAYPDGRHPEGVSFVDDLAEDLRRRDFTVNAMAMDLGGAVTDLCGGREDLEARLIRCVGDPETRFREDALRMLRAYRFAAQLGFSVEEKTEAAIFRCADGCLRLSRERVTEEVEKTLLSPRPEYLEKMAAAGLLAGCGVETAPDLRPLAALPAEAATRWAGWKVLQPPLSPAEFRLPARTLALALAAAGAYRPARERPEWKRLIAEQGWQTAETAALLSGETDRLAEIRASGECVGLSSLAVTGRDFPELRGPAVGRLLDALLAHVLERPEDNERDILRKLAASLREPASGRGASDVRGR
jgi:tRNA nucleotidyltransferase (CCA-adding enzyme)